MPEAICCCLLVYKPLHTAVFINAVIYICIETFVHKTSILFELNGHMYCYYNVLSEANFVVYLKKNLKRPTCKEYVFMQNFKFGGVTVLAVQLFNKIKKKKEEEEEEDKEHEKTCFAVFPGCYVEIHLFLLNLFLFVCF